MKITHIEQDDLLIKNDKTYIEIKGMNTNGIEKEHILELLSQYMLETEDNTKYRIIDIVNINVEGILKDFYELQKIE